MIPLQSKSNASTALQMKYQNHRSRSYDLKSTLGEINELILVGGDRRDAVVFYICIQEFPRSEFKFSRNSQCSCILGGQVKNKSLHENYTGQLIKIVVEQNSAHGQTPCSMMRSSRSYIRIHFMQEIYDSLIIVGNHKELELKLLTFVSRNLIIDD